MAPLLRSSYAAETGATPGKGDTLTEAERQRAVDYLQQTQKEFLAALEGVSDAQWNFKPAEGRWSIAECAEHIAATEDMIWNMVTGKVMKSPAAPEKAAARTDDDKIVQMVESREKRVQAPEQVRPTGRWSSREEIVKHFKETRAAEIAYLGETQDDLRSHFAEHPLFKALDGYQWILLNGAHGKRHTAQILEVKADPAYPKS